VAAIEQHQAEVDAAGERWRDALAQLEYAERHGESPAVVERLANEVIEARVAMFQSGLQSGWALPAFLQSALDRDRRLLEVDPAVLEEMVGTRSCE
jgi:hypothetical protein